MPAEPTESSLHFGISKCRLLFMRRKLYRNSRLRPFLFGVRLK